MVFDNVLLHFIEVFPIYTNHYIGCSDLPWDRLRMRQCTPLAIRLWLSLQHLCFQKFKANSTTPISIDKVDSEWEIISIKILFEFVKSDFFGLILLFGWLRSINIFIGVDIHIFFLVVLVFETVAIRDISFHLKIYQVVKLFPSHPVGQNYDHWVIAQLHFVTWFIEVSLHEPDVILFTVEIASCREIGYSTFI